MERLTKRVGYRSEAAPLEDMDDALALQGLIDRLAAYEDTGLEPEEILDPVEMAKVAMALKENVSLRSQLAEATAERDEAVALIASLVDLCSVPQADQSKVFRRLVFGAGDYMGSGYAFIDAFYHIWDEFEESAAEPLYRSIRTALDGLRKEKVNEKVQG